MPLIVGIGWFLLGLSLVGVAYAVGSGLAVRWLFSRTISLRGHSPGVTILKPLCGDEVGLAARVAQFCDQDYAGPVQIIFGVRDALDPAVKVIKQLIADRPDRDIELVVDDRVHGSNLKISNLMNMERLVRFETLVVADSDVSVTRDYLARLMDTLAQPQVGYATCVYFGVPTGNLWSKLSAMAINYHLLPSVALGVRLKMAKPCFGPTMAFRKDVLDRAGGFAAFVDRLADDFEIGHAIRELGYTFAISPVAIGHACPETSGQSLVSHELRWAKTIRLIDPAGYIGTVICHPLLFALLAVIVLHGGYASLATLALALGARLVVMAQVDRFSGRKLAWWWMAPARDLLSVAVFFTSFVGRDVMWRGRKLRIASNGVLVSARRSRPAFLQRPGAWAGPLIGQIKSMATPQRIRP